LHHIIYWFSVDPEPIFVQCELYLTRVGLQHDDSQLIEKHLLQVVQEARAKFSRSNKLVIAVKQSFYLGGIERLFNCIQRHSGAFCK